jgi:hypothetical protein
MLMASQKAKKGFSQANVASAADINAMLAANFTEYELQTMSSDLRFFFPEGRVLKHASTLGEIDCTDFPAADTAWLIQQAEKIQGA